MLLPQVFFSLSSLLPLAKSLTRLRIDPVAESPEFVIDNFPLNEAFSLNLDTSPDLLGSLPQSMKRLTNLSLVCADHFELKRTLSFPFLRSLQIYPHPDSQHLNSFSVSEECQSLERIEVFGKCKLQIHTNLEQLRVVECSECDILIKASV